MRARRGGGCARHFVDRDLAREVRRDEGLELQDRRVGSPQVIHHHVACLRRALVEDEILGDHVRERGAQGVAQDREHEVGVRERGAGGEDAVRLDHHPVGAQGDAREALREGRAS